MYFSTRFCCLIVVIQELQLHLVVLPTLMTCKLTEWIDSYRLPSTLLSFCIGIRYVGAVTVTFQVLIAGANCGPLGFFFFMLHFNFVLLRDWLRFAQQIDPPWLIIAQQCNSATTVQCHKADSDLKCMSSIKYASTLSAFENSNILHTCYFVLGDIFRNKDDLLQSTI